MAVGSIDGIDVALSGVTIDAHKDWQAKNITNAGEVYATKVEIEDLGLKYGWVIRETPKALLFLKKGKLIAKLTKDGFEIKKP